MVSLQLKALTIFYFTSVHSLHEFTLSYWSGSDRKGGSCSQGYRGGTCEEESFQKEAG